MAAPNPSSSADVTTSDPESLCLYCMQGLVGSNLACMALICGHCFHERCINCDMAVQKIRTVRNLRCIVCRMSAVGIETASHFTRASPAARPVGRKELTPEEEEPERRRKKFREIAASLQNPRDFPVMMRALCLLESMKPTSSEMLESKIGIRLRKLHEQKVLMHPLAKRVELILSSCIGKRGARRICKVAMWTCLGDDSGAVLTDTVN